MLENRFPAGIVAGLPISLPCVGSALARCKAVIAALLAHASMTAKKIVLINAVAAWRKAAPAIAAGTAVLVVAGCGGPPAGTSTPGPSAAPTAPGAAVNTPAPAPSGTRAPVEPRCPAPVNTPDVPVAILSDGATSVEAVVGPGLIRVCGASIPIEGPPVTPAETVLVPRSASISLSPGWRIVRWDALATDLPHLVRLPAGSGEPPDRPSAIRDAIGLWPGERYLLDVSIEAVDEAGTAVVSVVYGFLVRVP